jgi:hypothetical protein
MPPWLSDIGATVTSIDNKMSFAKNCSNSLFQKKEKFIQNASMA